MFPLIGITYFAATTIPLMIYDLRERRLPNKITLPGVAVALVSLALTMEWSRFLIALGISALLFLVGTLISVRGWIGMGDVKLIAGITLSLAWFNPLLPAIAVLIGLVIAGAVSLALVALRKASMGSSIALGPYLLVGFVLSLIGQGWS